MKLRVRSFDPAIHFDTGMDLSSPSSLKLVIIGAELQLLGLGGVHIEDLFQGCLGNPIICKHEEFLVGFDLGEDRRDPNPCWAHLVTGFVILALTKDIGFESVPEKMSKFTMRISDTANEASSSSVQPAKDAALL